MLHLPMAFVRTAWINCMAMRNGIRRIIIQFKKGEKNGTIWYGLFRRAQAGSAVAAAYSGKTMKAIRRDVEKLLDMGLIEITLDGVRPKKEIISAFLGP